MADKKITQLPSLSFISGSTTGYYAGEVVLPIVHNSTTVKIEAQKFALYATQWSATTASNTFIGNQTVNGNVVITGKLTAQEMHTEITSASIIFESGSTIFGNTADDTHTFTGTININGKVVGNEPLDFTSQSLNIATGSYNRLYDVTSSVHFTTASLNTQTGSQQLINVQNSTVTSSLNLATASLNFTTGALNIASGSYNRFYQVTASVHSTTASLNQATSSLNFASGALNIATGSYNRFYDMTSSVHFTTQSLNVQTGSQELINVQNSTVSSSLNFASASINFTTGALNSFTGSIISQTNTIATFTSSVNFATSSLNTQTGSQSNLNAQIGISTSSLNFTTGALNSFTGSIIGQNNTISTFTASVNFTTQSLNTQTGSQQSMNTTLSIVTGSMRAEIGGIEAYTASLKSAIVVNGSSVRIIGELSASRIYTEFITSSVLFVTGSNIIGDQSTDNHEFTGSVNINDTLFIKGQAIGLGELNAFTGSQIGKDGTLAIVTSSLRAEIGGIEAYTASLKAATIISSSTQIFTGYDYEIHVSQVDGNDTTGNGDLLTPVATITKALQIVSSSYLSTDRRTIIIHPGTYTESPTVTLANTYIFALGLLGANTAIAGTLTINAACRVSGIKMTNLIVNTTGAVYINNTTVDTQMTVTNTGYLETTGCSFQCTSGVTISGAAPGVVFNSTTLWGLVVNNASAVVIVRNSPQVLVATVTTGNLALSNTLLFSSTPTGNAITTSASSVVTLSNLNILDNTGLNVARVSLSGFYSIIDVVYDKPNSTLVSLSGTGGPLNAIDYFQYINADKFITQGGTGYQFLKGDGSLDSIMPASLQQTTASLNTFTGSIQSEVSGIEVYTASLKGAAIVSSSQQIPELFRLMQATASLNTTTGSFSTIVNQILQTTASLNTYTGSSIGIDNGLMAYTSSLKSAFTVSGTTTTHLGPVNLSDNTIYSYFSQPANVSSGNTTVYTYAQTSGEYCVAFEYSLVSLYAPSGTNLFGVAHGFAYFMADGSTNASYKSETIANGWSVVVAATNAGSFTITFTNGGGATMSNINLRVRKVNRVGAG